MTIFRTIFEQVSNKCTNTRLNGFPWIYISIFFLPLRYKCLCHFRTITRTLLYIQVTRSVNFILKFNGCHLWSRNCLSFRSTWVQRRIGLFICILFFFFLYFFNLWTLVILCVNFPIMDRYYYIGFYSDDQPPSKTDI